jgi:hypothetical protein
MASAIHNFEGLSIKELSFKKGQKLIIVKRHHSGWCLGKLKKDEPTSEYATGWFPLSKQFDVYVTHTCKILLRKLLTQVGERTLAFLKFLLHHQEEPL